MNLGNRHVHEYSLPKPWVYCVIAAVGLVVNGCNGGLIGSSTGPRDETGTVVYLPRVVSPRIPDALLNRESRASESDLQTDITNRADLGDASGDPAQSWQQLSPFFSQIETTRIALQLELRLLDSVYQDVISRCGELTINGCVIPAGEIRATYTQNISDKFESEIAENDQTITGSQLRAVSAKQFLDVGNELVFGEISIKKISETPYAYGLAIDSLSLLPDENLQLKWSADFSSVRYSLRKVVLSTVDTYHYVRGAAAQRLTFSDSAGTENYLRPVGLRVSAGLIDEGNVLFEAHINGNNYSGEASDRSASASTLSSGENGNTLLEESFASDGDVVDSSFCTFDEGQTNETQTCLGTQGAGEGPSSGSSGEFTSQQITLENLPENIDYFQIRRNPAVHSMYVPDVLCDVYREVVYGLSTYCFVESSTVLSGIVVAIGDDSAEFIVDDAMIVLSEEGASISGGIVYGGTTDSRFTSVGPVVTGNVISWPDDGFDWYQVEDRLSGEIVCSSDSECILPDGVYWVSWFYTQDNGREAGGATRVVLGSPVEESDTTRENFADFLLVTDKTITWSIGGWYQVQNEQTLEAICNGDDSCTVPSAGRYIVINHSLGMRATVIVN